MSIFKKINLKLIRPTQNSTFGCNNSKGLTYMTKLRLDLNRLRDCKFKYSFQDTLNLCWDFRSKVETSTYYLLLLLAVLRLIMSLTHSVQTKFDVRFYFKKPIHSVQDQSTVMKNK